MQDPACTFSAAQLRQVLGTFITGVTVITTRDATGARFGVTANSFSSVSLDPPLVLWSHAVASPSHDSFRTAGRFAVNILAEDQVDLSRQFARSGADKFAGVKTAQGLGGIPVIEDCAATLECSTVHVVPGGDHAIFIGRVERIAHHQRKPLAFGGGSYLSAQPHEASMSSELREGSLAHLHAVRLACALLPNLATTLNAMVAVSVWGDGGPTVIRWEQPPRPLSANLRTARLCQLTTTATGALFAAFMPAAMTAPLVAAELAMDPSRTEHWRAAVNEIRHRGLSRVLGQRTSTASSGSHIDALSVPVRDASRRMALALTVVAPAGSINMAWDSEFAMAVTRAAARITARLQSPPGALS